MKTKLIPEEGEILMTKYGEATISRILSYDDVIDEMRRNGIAKKNIAQFKKRVLHFMGNTDRYFECELKCSDHEIRRIDWSEYYSLINPK